MQEYSGIIGPSYPRLTSAIITQQLERLLDSRTLARAHYLTRLLKCCVEQTLAGNARQLKELWLGTAVFKREGVFDPSHDPIVRVQARRLREKLALYYETEGMLDSVRITLPVGSYIPVFSTIDLRSWASVPSGRPCSIAVLPLAHLDEDNRTVQFSDVMTAELTHALVEMGGVEVVSRTSSLAYKGIATDIRTIGKALNADFIVEGSVRLDDNHHRINLQLTACETGYHCWAAWFEQRNTRMTPDVRRIAGLLHQELTASGVSRNGLRSLPSPQLTAAAGRPN